jgi:hypothetical protein
MSVFHSYKPITDAFRIGDVYDDDDTYLSIKRALQGRMKENEKKYKVVLQNGYGQLGNERYTIEYLPLQFPSYFSAATTSGAIEKFVKQNKDNEEVGVGDIDFEFYEGVYSSGMKLFLHITKINLVVLGNSSKKIPITITETFNLNTKKTEYSFKDEAGNAVYLFHDDSKSGGKKRTLRRKRRMSRCNRTTRNSSSA